MTITTATSGKGMSLVSEAIVRKEPRPEFTKSWHPFSHGEIIDAMEIATKEHHLEVIKREYSIRPDSKMLAAWEIKNGTKEYNFGIGFRNAIDKTHSVGVFLFTKIFVCANWNFATFKDWVLFRKHSGRLEMEEIVYYAKEAVGLIIPKMERFAKHHEEMKSISLSTRNASLISVGAMSRRLLPPAKFPEFWDLYHAPESKYREYGDSLYAWHGAMTELMKSNSLLSQTWEQDKLNHYIDYEVPAILKSADNPKTIHVDFKSISEEALKAQKKEKETIREELKTIASDVRTKYKELKSANGKDAPSKEKKENGSSVKKGKKDAPLATPNASSTSSADVLVKKRNDLKKSLTESAKTGVKTKRIEKEISKITKEIKRTEKEKVHAVKAERKRRKEVAKAGGLKPIVAKESTIEDLDDLDMLKPGEVITVQKKK